MARRHFDRLAIQSLLKHFGARYPVSNAEADAWLAKAPKNELSRIFTDAMLSAARRNGLDTERLRQGSFFTRTGKIRVLVYHPEAGEWRSP